MIPGPVHDLIVIGAGPAGLAAAVAARVLGVETLVLDGGPLPGGQLLRNPTPIRDCPGIEAPSGPLLAQRLRDHLAREGGVVESGQLVERLDGERGEVVVAGQTRRARFLLLATGARPRRLGIPGEAEAIGRGRSPVAREHGERYRGRTVLVVGGGDVALEEALLFAERCERVLLAHRGDRFRARHDFVAAAAANRRIEIRFATTLQAIEGHPDVEWARIRGPAGDERLAVAGVVICAGLAPASELVIGQVALDPQDFVITDVRQRTSLPRLYAAGDLCAASPWTVAAALGQGATAVKDIERRLWGTRPPGGPSWPPE